MDNQQLITHTNIEWRDIPVYENYYKVSNKGEILSISRRVKSSTGTRNVPEKILKSNIDKYGYLYIILRKEGVYKHFTIHKLVALSFIENPNNYYSINHKDENKLNNEVSNLEWCTVGYNNSYNNRQESITIKTKITNTLKFGKKVLQLNKEGNIINTYPSLRELSRITGYSRGSIKNACLKNKIAYNYFWKFV